MFKGTPEEFELLGRAFAAVPSKDMESQDARGFNKCIDAVWTLYNYLQQRRTEAPVYGGMPGEPMQPTPKYPLSGGEEKD